MMLMQLLFLQSTIASHLGYAFVDVGAKLPVDLCSGTDVNVDESSNADIDRTKVRSQVNAGIPKEWVES